jgi:hypothetical protein
MSTSVSQTTIELQSPQSPATWDASTQPADTDAIIEASRLADASVPEGGYGWVVLFSCGVITWWFVGTTYSWGVIQGALVKQGLASPSTLSFVGSLTIALNAILAIASSRVLRKLGARNTGLVGITCLGVGGILSGFSADSVGGLFVTTGVITGIGVSTSFIVSQRVMGLWQGYLTA